MTTTTTTVLSLNLVLAYGIPPEFRDGVHLFICSTSCKEPTKNYSRDRQLTSVQLVLSSIISTPGRLVCPHFFVKVVCSLCVCWSQQQCVLRTNYYLVVFYVLLSYEIQWQHVYTVDQSSGTASELTWYTILPFIRYSTTNRTVTTEGLEYCVCTW